MKICPYCEGELSNTARKCKFCGEWVSKKGEDIKNDNYLSDTDFNEYISTEISKTTDIKLLNNLNEGDSEILSSNNSYLNLNGLTNITDKQTEIFSNFKGTLSLNGLTNITDKQAEIFSSFTGTLSLNGLTNITDNQAKIFSNFKGEYLSFGLTNITDKQAEILSNFKGKFLSFKGLTNITDRQAEIFSNFKGYLNLNGLTNITDRQAEIFSNFKGKSLSLIGLTDITEYQFITINASHIPLSKESKILMKNLLNKKNNSRKGTIEGNVKIIHPKITSEYSNLNSNGKQTRGKNDGDYHNHGNTNEKQRNKKENNVKLWIGFIVFSIIAGFIIPSETATERFFVISSIIAIYEIYKEYKEKKRLEIMQIFLGIFGAIIGTFILSLTTYIISSLALTCIYKIGIINPETYSRIYCNKVAGSLEKHHCSIKGNVSFDTGEKIYHKPGCENYNNTVINEAYGELYFPDEETAQKAGFRKCKDDVIYDWAPGMYDDY